MARPRAIRVDVRRSVLIEAGYRCAVPTCRNLLVLDLHHIVPVRDGGSDDAHNLLALCPTCHQLFERGTMDATAVRTYKATLEALSHAFDTESLDLLVFLDQASPGSLGVDGTGLLRFARLAANGLAEWRLGLQNGPLLLYTVQITDKGRRLLEAWRTANRDVLSEVLAT